MNTPKTDAAIRAAMEEMNSWSKEKFHAEMNKYKGTCTDWYDDEPYPIDDAHEWIRNALKLDETDPYRFDFYAQEIEKLVAYRDTDFNFTLDSIFKKENT